MKKRWIGVFLAMVMLLSGIAVSADVGIEILEQPTDIRAAIGETGSATVVAESEGEIGYQWYYRPANGTEWLVSGMPGADTATLRVQVIERRLGQQYKCVLTDENGEQIETEVVQVVNAEPSEITIVTGPADIRAKIGSKGSATVEAFSDAELRYQWYFKTANGSEWKVSGMEGSQTPTITVPVTAARIGQQYKCVITTADGAKVETDAIRVLEPEPGEITIDAQPDDIRARLGSEGTATVSAHAEAELSYQWYYKKTANSTEWKASGMQGSQTPTITVPVTGNRIGQQYKCVMTAADGGRAETVTVTILEPVQSVITIEQQHGDYAEIGKNWTASVTAATDSGAELRYQWYFKKTENSTEWKVSGMEGNQTAAITVPVTAARIGQQYKCVITTEDGATVESEVFTMRERPAYAVTVIRNPNTYIVPEGQPILLTVAAQIEADDGNADGFEMEYQWYQDDVAIDGATESELVFYSVALENAGSYYCVVSVNGVTASSRAGTVEVIVPEQS